MPEGREAIVVPFNFLLFGLRKGGGRKKEEKREEKRGRIFWECFRKSCVGREQASRFFVAYFVFLDEHGSLGERGGKRKKKKRKKGRGPIAGLAFFLIYVTAKKTE